MFGQKARGAVIALTIFSLPVSQANACDWLHRCFGCGSSTSYYAPAAYAPAPCCQPACAPQVVNYMPQTSYRTVYVNAPVVAYRPVTACDACGGATTVMRPVTSYMLQARVVPYTTYRPVVTAGYAPAAPACGGCAAPAPVTAAYYAPAIAPAPAPSCCTANYAAPAVTNYAPAAAVTRYAPGATVTSQAPAPNYGAPPSQIGTSVPFNASPPSNPSQPNTAQPNPTFEQPTTPQDEPQSRTLQPLKLAPSSSNNGAPRSLDPEDQDRTTALPIRQALAARPVSTVVAAAAASQGLDDSGWRTARH
jgi:hypothetical protein